MLCREHQWFEFICFHHHLGPSFYLHFSWFGATALILSLEGLFWKMFKSDHTISTQRRQGPMWWRPAVSLLRLAPSLFPSHPLQPHWPVGAVSPAHETVFSPGLCTACPAPLPRLLFLQMFQVFAQMSPLQTVLNMPLKIVTSPHLHTLHPHPNLLFIFACFDHRSPSNI